MSGFGIPLRSAVSIGVGGIPSLESGGLLNAQIQMGQIIQSARTTMDAARLGQTLHTAYDMPTGFSEVAVLMSSVATTDQIDAKAAISTGDAASWPFNGAGTWVPITWGGAATTTIPAGTAARPSITMSDFVPLSSDASNQLFVRTYVPAAGNTECCINPGIDLATLPTLAGSRRVMRSQAGDFIATPASLTSGTNRNFAGHLGVLFKTTTSVISVMGLGDSIMAGSTLTDIVLWNYIQRAVYNVSGYTAANEGWGGQTTTEYSDRGKDIIPTTRPHVLFYPVWSPNDSVTITDAVITTMMDNLAAIQAMCIAYDVLLIPVTGTPRNLGTVPFYTDGEDQKRKDLNNYIRSNFTTYFDYDLLIADDYNKVTASMIQLTANGFPTDLTDDGLHPNTAGVTLAQAAVESILTAIINNW